MGPINHPVGIPLALNHRVGMPTYYESIHPTRMEHSRTITIGLKCPITYTYNNQYYGSNHPLGWNTPCPQPSGWNANLLRVQSSYRDGIFLAHNHRVRMPTYYDSNHPTWMEYSWTTTIGLECSHTNKHVHLPDNHIIVHITTY